MDRQTFEKHLNFEVLTKLFFDLAEERFPAAEKIKLTTSRLVDTFAENPLEAVLVKIGVLNAMRDMVKEVAPAQIYRTPQHRDDLYVAIIEALEDLEDELEEIESQTEEEEP